MAVGIDIPFVPRVYTAKYTGDDTTAQDILNSGFRPKYYKIWEEQTSDNAALFTFEGTDEMMEDIAAGATMRKTDGDTFRIKDNRVTAILPNGIRVSDDGINGHPNKSGRIYNVLMIG